MYGVKMWLNNGLEYFVKMVKMVYSDVVKVSEDIKLVLNWNFFSLKKEIYVY